MRKKTTKTQRAEKNLCALCVFVVLFLSSIATGQSRRSNKPSPNYIPIEVAQRFGVQQVGEISAESVHSVLRKTSRGPEALINQADQLVKAGKIERAIELYRKAIAYIPNNAEAQLNLGVALYYSGHIVEAITQYELALKKREKFPEAHFNLAMACSHQGDFNKAIEHYRVAITQRGNSYPEALNNLGLIYEAMGDSELSATQFRLAIEQKGGHYPLARYNLARLYEYPRDYNRAIAELQLAISQQSDFPEAHLNLAKLYMLRTNLMGTDELERAIAECQKAIALRQNFYPLAHENLAIAFSMKGRKEEALAEYRIAFDQYEGQCPDTLNNLITTLSNKETFSIGNELSRSDNPGNLTSRKSGTQVSKSIAENIREALSKYMGLNEKLKTFPDVHYCAGLASSAIGDWDGAIDEFACAIKLSNNRDPDAKRALISIFELILYI